jgi:hypothetical protein
MSKTMAQLIPYLGSTALQPEDSEFLILGGSLAHSPRSSINFTDEYRKEPSV